jgi:hypothetical protein
MVKRYRKGQQYRPPTAAESAMHADALAGFQNQPAGPQDLTPRSHVIFVKTPSGGIEARDNTTMFSAECTICVETSEADEKTLKDTDEPIVVFNIYPIDVPGSTYVPTDLTVCGTRYAQWHDMGLRWGKLDAQLNSGSSATVSLWQATGGGWEGWDEDSGTDQVGVNAPPVLSTGSVASSKWVLYARLNGKLVALLHEC